MTLVSPKDMLPVAYLFRLQDRKPSRHYKQKTMPFSKTISLGTPFAFLYQSPCQSIKKLTLARNFIFKK